MDAERERLAMFEEYEIALALHEDGDQGGGADTWERVVKARNVLLALLRASSGAEQREPEPVSSRRMTRAFEKWIRSEEVKGALGWEHFRAGFLAAAPQADTAGEADAETCADAVTRWLGTPSGQTVTNPSIERPGTPVEYELRARVYLTFEAGWNAARSVYSASLSPSPSDSGEET